MKEKEDIQTAEAAARSCAASMNEAIESVNEAVEVRDLQARFNDSSLVPIFSHPNAKVLKSETLTKISRNGRKEYLYCLIAPDMLISCIEDPVTESLKLRRALKLLPKLSKVEIGAEPNSFIVTVSDYMCGLISTSEFSRDEWIKLINDLISQLDLIAIPLPPGPTHGKKMSGLFRKSSSAMHYGSNNSLSESLSSAISQKQQERCHICSSTFSLLHRKHNCSRCRLDCCSSCSTQRRCLQQGQQQQPSRICDVCTEEMDFCPVSTFSNCIRLHLDINGGFRKEGLTPPTEKLPREPFWAVSLDDQFRGPSSSGKFSLYLPNQPDLKNASLYLFSKSGSILVACCEVPILEIIRNPRCTNGFTERFDLLDTQNSSSVDDYTSS